MKGQIIKNSNSSVLLKYHSSTITNLEYGTRLSIYAEDSSNLKGSCFVDVYAFPVYEIKNPEEAIQIGNKRYYTESKKYLTGYSVDINKSDGNTIAQFSISINNMCMLTQCTSTKYRHIVLTFQDVIQYLCKGLDVDNIDPEIIRIIDEFIKNLQHRTHCIAALHGKEMI